MYSASQTQMVQVCMLQTSAFARLAKAITLTCIKCACSEMGLWPCTSHQKQHLERLLGRIPPLAPPPKASPPAQPEPQGAQAVGPGMGPGHPQMLPPGPHRPHPRPPPPAPPAPAHLPFNGPVPVQGEEPRLPYKSVEISCKWKYLKSCSSSLCVAFPSGSIQEGGIDQLPCHPCLPGK